MIAADGGLSGGLKLCCCEVSRASTKCEEGEAREGASCLGPSFLDGKKGTLQREMCYYMQDIDGGNSQFACSHFLAQRYYLPTVK